MRKFKMAMVLQLSEEDKAAIARVYNLMLDIQHEMTETARLQSNITGDDSWLSAEELSETEAVLYWLATRSKMSDTIFIQEGRGN